MLLSPHAADMYVPTMYMHISPHAIAMYMHVSPHAVAMYMHVSPHAVAMYMHVSLQEAEQEPLSGAVKMIHTLCQDQEKKTRCVDTVVK